MIDDNFRINYRDVRVATHEQTDNTVITMPHNHMEAELILIEKGRALVTIDQKSYNVGEGDIVFVNPMQIHSLESDKGEEYHHYCVCLDCVIIIVGQTVTCFICPIFVKEKCYGKVGCCMRQILRY